MTMVNQALTLRMKLLIAEYGRKRVIAALAQIEDVEFETIEREVNAAREISSSRRRRPKALPELLKEAKIDSQRILLVERIASAYDNKRYLPELWRVRRFLESHGVDASKLRTRTAALPLIVKVLEDLSESELTELLAGLSASEKGDLKIIADQILGPSTSESRAVKGVARESDEREEPVRSVGAIE